MDVLDIESMLSSFLAHQNEQVVMRTTMGEKKHKKELSHTPAKEDFSVSFVTSLRYATGKKSVVIKSM